MIKKQTIKRPSGKDDKRIKFTVRTRIGIDTPLEYEIKSDRMGQLTKEEAFRFLELKTFEGERGVRERHVQFLFDEYQAGRFLWHHVLIGSAILDDEEYRINGQHTCWMRVNVASKDEPIPAECRFIQYKVKHVEDLRKLYSAFDRNAPRTVGHVSNVMLMETRAGRELPRYIITQCVAGFRIYFAEDWNAANANPNELVAIIRENYAEVFNTVGHFLAPRRDYHIFIRRAAVTAGMMATFEKSVKASFEFWDPVCTGLGLEKKEDPRWQLRQYLMTHGHTTTAKGMDMVSQEDMFRICVNLWNHWRRGSEVSVVKPIGQRIKPI